MRKHVVVNRKTTERPALLVNLEKFQFKLHPQSNRRGQSLSILFRKITHVTWWLITPSRSKHFFVSEIKTIVLPFTWPRSKVLHNVVRLSFRNLMTVSTGQTRIRFFSFCILLESDNKLLELG